MSAAASRQSSNSYDAISRQHYNLSTAFRLGPWHRAFTAPWKKAMDASVISALAALLGAGIGGLTSVLASWLNQHTQARAQWLTQDKIRRQDLYKEFIEEASRSHIDSLQNDKPDLPALIGLYANISRMRIMSSPNVVESADQIVRAIVDNYLAPNKTFPELRDMLNDGSIDLLRDFSEACRTEFESLQAAAP
jgi:hypothetical protein